MSNRYAVCHQCGAMGVVGGQCDYCGATIVAKEGDATYEARIVSKRTVSPAEFAKKVSIFKHVGKFFDGCAVVSIGNLYGLINLNGDLILPLEYHCIKLYGLESLDATIAFLYHHDSYDGGEFFDLMKWKRIGGIFWSDPPYRIWDTLIHFNKKVYYCFGCEYKDKSDCLYVFDENGKMTHEVYKCYSCSTPEYFVFNERDYFWIVLSFGLLNDIIYIIDENGAVVQKLENWGFRSEIQKFIDSEGRWDTQGVCCATKYFDFKTFKLYSLPKDNHLSFTRNKETRSLELEYDVSFSDISIDTSNDDIGARRKRASDELSAKYGSRFVHIDTDADDIQAEIDKARDELLAKFDANAPSKPDSTFVQGCVFLFIALVFILLLLFS